MDESESLQLPFGLTFIAIKQGLRKELNMNSFRLFLYTKFLSQSFALFRSRICHISSEGAWSLVAHPRMFLKGLSCGFAAFSILWSFKVCWLWSSLPCCILSLLPFLSFSCWSSSSLLVLLFHPLLLHRALHPDLPVEQLGAVQLQC